MEGKYLLGASLAVLSAALIFTIVSSAIPLWAGGSGVTIGLWKACVTLKSTGTVCEDLSGKSCFSSVFLSYKRFHVNSVGFKNLIFV